MWGCVRYVGSKRSGCDPTLNVADKKPFRKSFTGMLRASSNVSAVNEQDVGDEEADDDLEASELYAAFTNNDMSVVSKLITSSRGPRMLRKRMSNNGRYFLHVLCKSKNETKVDKMLDECLQAGANINSTDFAGHTPLSLACLIGNLATVTALLDRGADINLANVCGETPLHMACYNHNLALAELLIQRKANPCCTDANGSTLIHFCCSVGAASFLSVLQDHGAYINQCDRWFRTPLMVAARNKKIECVRALLELGCSVDDTDGAGCNAAWYTMQGTFIPEGKDVIMALVSKGIDIYAAADDGSNFLTLLKEKCGRDYVAQVEAVWMTAEKPTAYVLK